MPLDHFLGEPFMKLKDAVSSFLVAGIMLCAVAFAQDAARKPPQLDVETEKLIKGIRAGDVNALGVAAASGKQVFVPYLKEQWRNPKAKLHGERSLLQIGLAKAGELQQLRQISCELNFGDGSTRFDAMVKLKSVEGWFAISNLAEFLKDDPNYTSVFGQGLGRLQDYALQFLPELVPPPPPAPPQVQSLDHTKVIAVWKDYLDSHRDTLLKLPPTGNGVVISDAICGRILRRTRSQTGPQSPKHGNIDDDLGANSHARSSHQCLK
jgi:hypothetical protein